MRNKIIIIICSKIYDESRAVAVYNNIFGNNYALR